MRRRRNLNVRKGSKGFQETTQGRDAPTSGDPSVSAGRAASSRSLNPVDFLAERVTKTHEWLQRRKNTGNLMDIGGMFGFEGLPTHDSGGWINNNQGGPGYRSVSPQESERMFVAQRLDEVGRRLSTNTHGLELQEITAQVTQIREKLKKSSRPYSSCRGIPSAEERQESERLLAEVRADIDSLERERESL